MLIVVTAYCKMKLIILVIIENSDSDNKCRMTLLLYFKDLKKLFDESRGGLPLDLVRSYMQQLLRGIAFCHANRILHRDLKPQNLLIDARGTWASQFLSKGYLDWEHLLAFVEWISCIIQTVLYSSIIKKSFRIHM